MGRPASNDEFQLTLPAQCCWTNRQAVTARLKHALGKTVHTILASQPSEDPNDPLNWSYAKKTLVLVVLYFGVIIFGIVLAGTTLRTSNSSWSLLVDRAHS
jgi:hypothetical protein